MILVADVGNSRCKWAQLEGGTLRGHGSVPYVAATLAATLDEHWHALGRPEQVVACSVGGREVAQVLSSWVGSVWGVECRLVKPMAAGYGVTNAYVEPATLGADRWAALVAARRRFRKPSCIVDCGTAITLDVLARDGRHLGGLIVPGIGLMRRSLVENTKEIGQITSTNVSLLARSTGDAVTAGTLYAAVALIDRVLNDVAAELRAGLVCVLTGGDAGTVRPLLARETLLEPDFVLQGLAVIAGNEA